jgi:hypothetical protein
VFADRGDRPLKVTAAARVTLTVEVTVGSTWGGECAVSQVHDQASAEAQGIINALITCDPSTAKIQIIGTPSVRVVLADIDAKDG